MPVLDGFYSATYRGQSDWGTALIVFHGGKVTGVDQSGGTYEGRYAASPNDIDLHIVVTVPPGVALAQGTPPQPRAYTFTLKTRLPSDFANSGKHYLIETEQGPVNVIFKKLREWDK